ncbi:hypothetical protein Tco_0574213 [Tanacetum coccineum]
MAAVEVTQTLEYRVLFEYETLYTWKTSQRQDEGFMEVFGQKDGRKGHFTRDCFSKTLVPSYESPFQPKLLHSSEHKPELRHTKDFEAKYNKVKAKLALLNSSASSPKSSSGKNKGLITETYEWDEEEVLSNENEEIEVKALMALANEERVSVSKESASNGDWIKIFIQKCISEQIPTQKKKLLGIDQFTEDTSSFGPKDPVFVKSLADNSEVSITGSNKPMLSEAEDSTLSNHDTGKHPLPPLEKLAGAKPVPGLKTIKSNLKSSPTFKAKTLKDITLKEPSSAPAKDNKKVLFCKKCKRTDHRTCDHAEFMSFVKISPHHTDQDSVSSVPSSRDRAKNFAQRPVCKGLCLKYIALKASRGRKSCLLWSGQKRVNASFCGLSVTAPRRKAKRIHDAKIRKTAFSTCDDHVLLFIKDDNLSGKPNFKVKWSLLTLTTLEVDILANGYPGPPTFLPGKGKIIQALVSLNRKVGYVVASMLEEVASWDDLAFKLICSRDLVKEIMTNIGGEFSNLEDLEVLES